MKEQNILFGLALALAALLSGCGGGGSSSPPGTISMNVADARPRLPEEGVESVTITFDEVSVYRSGGSWIPLPMVTYPWPYPINLYRFSDGSGTQFVPPIDLESGKYTQVRIGVTSGTMRINGQDHDLVIPSTGRKTEKKCEFDVPIQEAADITVDFDLSQSIALTGPDTYQLIPVFHIVETSKAATVQGTINFGASTRATVTVTWDKNPDGNPLDPYTDEAYTSISVKSTDPSPFKIFWLVPGMGYFVRVLWGDPQNPAGTYEEYVDKTRLLGGAIYDLNGGHTISPR